MADAVVIPPNAWSNAVPLAVSVPPALTTTVRARAFCFARKLLFIAAAKMVSPGLKVVICAEAVGTNAQKYNPKTARIFNEFRIFIAPTLGIPGLLFAIFPFPILRYRRSTIAAGGDARPTNPYWGATASLRPTAGEHREGGIVYVDADGGIK